MVRKKEKRKKGEGCRRRQRGSDGKFEGSGPKKQVDGAPHAIVWRNGLMRVQKGGESALEGLGLGKELQRTGWANPTK